MTESILQPHSTPISWRLIRLVFSVILIVTAFLKWRDFGYSNTLYDIAPSLEFGLIQFEVLLSLWLMSGWKTVAAWFSTLSLFATFAGASFAMVLQKKASCGCFGSVDFNPAWVFAIDIIAVCILILVGRIENQRAVSISVDWGGLQRMWSLTMTISLVTSTIGFAGIYFNAEVGSWYARNMPIAITGQSLVTEPSVVAARPGVDGEWQSLTFAVVNRGKGPVRLIGAEQNCKCRAIQSLPIVVPAGEQVEVIVDVKLGSKSSFGLLTSSQRQARLVCRWKEFE